MALAGWSDRWSGRLAGLCIYLLSVVGCSKVPVPPLTEAPEPGKLAGHIDVSTICKTCNMNWPFPPYFLGSNAGNPVVVVGCQQSPELTRQDVHVVAVRQGVVQALPGSRATAEWLILSALVEDNKITVVQAGLGGVDTLIAIPLDGSPSQRVSRPTAGVVTGLATPDRVGGDLYACGIRVGSIRMADTVPSLLRIPADGGPWQEADHTEPGGVCGAIAHDARSVYWSSSRGGIRSVPRNGGPATTIMHSVTKDAASPLILVGDYIVTAVIGAQETTVYQIKQDVTASLDQAVVLLRYESRLASPELAVRNGYVYVAWEKRVVRVRLSDRHQEILAVPPEGTDFVRLVTVGDAVYYASSVDQYKSCAIDIWSLQN